MPYLFSVAVEHAATAAMMGLKYFWLKRLTGFYCAWKLLVALGEFTENSTLLKSECYLEIFYFDQDMQTKNMLWRRKNDLYHSISGLLFKCEELINHKFIDELKRWNPLQRTTYMQGGI